MLVDAIESNLRPGGVVHQFYQLGHEPERLVPRLDVHAEGEVGRGSSYHLYAGDRRGSLSIDLTFQACDASVLRLPGCADADVVSERRVH